MSETGRNSDAGFTLLEMLVVLAIVALVSSLSYPLLAHGLNAEKMRSAGIEAGAILHARSADARRSDMPVTVAATAFGRLPANVAVAVQPTEGIRFYPDGSSSGGVLTLSGDGRQLRYRVDQASGQVRSGG